MRGRFQYKIAYISRTVKDNGKRLKFLGFVKGVVLEGFFLLADKNWSGRCACVVASNIKSPISQEPLRISKNG